MKKISVIVPVYKVEKFLNRCIDSLVNQTYKNIEIILVDDGSTDRCPEICDEYARKDKRIKVIHKENGGLSEARNFGIDIATGEYIGFVDSDDYINEEMYEILAKELEKNDSDISMCKYQKFNEDIYSEDKGNLEYEVNNLSNIQALDKMYEEDGVEFIVAWNKLYKREFFKKIRYPVGKIHEDEYTTYKVLFYSKKITCISKNLYYYYQREDSIMGTKFNAKNLDFIDALEERNIFFEKEELKKLFFSNNRFLFWNCLVFYNKLKKNNNRDLCFELKRKMNQAYKVIKKEKELSMLKKIKYSLANYIPELYSIVYGTK